MNNFPTKQYAWTIVSLVLIVLIVALAVVGIKNSRTLKQAQAQAISSVDYNFGSKFLGSASGKAILYPVSKPSITKAAAISCGSNIDGNIEVANFQLIVYGKVLGFPVIYKFNLPGQTFTPGQNQLWNGQLQKVSLNLSNRKSDNIIVYQYQNCDTAAARILNINPNTQRLEPYQFRTLSNNISDIVLVRIGSSIKSTAQNKIDTIADSGDFNKPFAIVHWQLDPKLNIFKETAKDLSATAR